MARTRSGQENVVPQHAMSWSRLLNSTRRAEPGREAVDAFQLAGVDTTWHSTALAHLRPGPEAFEATGMSALPDEVLLSIFGKLKHGPTLLDVLPLVCKRWCRLARDPASWAAAELTVANQLADEARVLLHAPAAKSLTLDPWLAGYPLPAYLVRSALQRTRVEVQALRVLEGGRSQPEAGLQSAVVGFLARQRDSLRELRLHLSRHHDCGDASTWHAVGMLRGLRTLEVVTASGVVYGGELRGRLPDLRKLTLHVRCPRDPVRPALPRGLVGDLVRGAPALRVLDLDMPEDGDRDACAELRGLQHVALNAFQDDEGALRPLEELAVGVVRKAFDLLQQVETPALRTAVVSLCRGEHARYSLELQHECHDLLEALCPLMPHVAVQLDIDGPGCRQCTLFPSQCPGQAWAGLAAEADEVAIPVEQVAAAEPADSIEDAKSEDDSEDYIAEIVGVYDSEPDVSCDFVPDDICDSDCDYCASKFDSFEDPAASESDPDPEMYYE